MVFGCSYRLQVRRAFQRAASATRPRAAAYMRSETARGAVGPGVRLSTTTWRSQSAYDRRCEPRAVRRVPRELCDSKLIELAEWVRPRKAVEI